MIRQRTKSAMVTLSWICSTVSLWPRPENNGNREHTKTEQQKKESSGRPQKGSIWSLFQGGQISETSRTSSPTAPLLGLKLQSWWGEGAGEFPKNRGLPAYRTHFNCFWQERTVVKSVWSQEQVHIWQNTPIKAAMSTTIEYFGKTGNVHLWEPGKIWQIFVFPALYQQVNYSNRVVYTELCRKAADSMKPRCCSPGPEKDELTVVLTHGTIRSGHSVTVS